MKSSIGNGLCCRFLCPFSNYSTINLVKKPDPNRVQTRYHYRYGGGTTTLEEVLGKVNLLE